MFHNSYSMGHISSSMKNTCLRKKVEGLAPGISVLSPQNSNLWTGFQSYLISLSQVEMDVTSAPFYTEQSHSQPQGGKITIERGLCS